MHLLHLDHGLSRFCDWKRQHDLALLDALPSRLLGGCLREVPHQNIPLYTALPAGYTLQRHAIIFGTVRSPHLKSAVLNGAWDGYRKGAEFTQEEKKCWSEVADLGAKFRAVLGGRKAEVKRGPAGFLRVGRAQYWRDHSQLGCAIKVERVRARGDVHLIGNGEDGLETDTLLA